MEENQNLTQSVATDSQPDNVAETSNEAVANESSEQAVQPVVQQLDGKPSSSSDVVALKKEKKPFFTAGNVAVIAILTAISFVLYAFAKFPLPFMFPSFLDIQFSDLPALLGGFAIGPVAGCIIIVLKCCLKMTMSTTACIGELADIIVGIAFVLPASLLYKKIKNRKGALLGMLLGMGVAVAASLLANWLILIPFYTKRFGIGAVLGMMQELYPKITEETLYNYYLPLAVLPFNILRCLICGVLTYFTYKPLSKALHWEIKIKPKKEETATTNSQPQTEQQVDFQEELSKGVDAINSALSDFEKEINNAFSSDSQSDSDNNKEE